jgi:transketolase
MSDCRQAICAYVDRQDAVYRQTVIPNGVPTFGLTSGLPSTLLRVAPNGKIFGLNHFGASAPYKVLDEKFGFTPENIAKCIVEALK